VSASIFRTGEEFAAEMDARDPLARYRELFCIPKKKDGNECIYLSGHSLGLQPKTARAYIDQELLDWADLGVEGHFHAKNPWMPYHRLLTEQTATLVGAKASEVVVMNSLTVNLHLMMTSFYRPTADRHKIVIEAGAFPSDQYAVKSQIRFHGLDPSSSLIELTPRQNETCIRDEDIESLIEREGKCIALILLGGVNYATGQVFDMAGITRAGHRKGCIVAFDLAHAAGNIPLKLHDWDPDFAVWCSYKYLNGGPGCVGGCFVHERHSNAKSMPRFTGWWGHDERVRFRMEPDFKPMPGAEGWQLSNPPIMALAPLRASMEIFSAAGMEALRKKSVTITAYLEFLLGQIKSTAFAVCTPMEEDRRGSQLSIQLRNHDRGLCNRLIQRGVIGDWREPNVFRVAPIPLYNTYSEVYAFVQHFDAALKEPA
jgi:kynureninase